MVKNNRVFLIGNVAYKQYGLTLAYQFLTTKYNKWNCYKAIPLVLFRTLMGPFAVAALIEKSLKYLKLPLDIKAGMA